MWNLRKRRPLSSVRRRWGVSGRQAVRRCGALPADLRECLVLHELEELSYKEVAHVTGVPIGTVMSRLWRARKALMRSQGAGQ